MKNYKITSNQISKMKHCIGFSKSKVRGIKYRKMDAYRNYFTTGSDEKELDELVEQGLMCKRNFRNGVGDNPKVYFVTEEGFKFLSKLVAIEIREAD